MPKPFLTPEFTSETWQCRTLRTPDNKEWLGVFNSALLEMTNRYNWEQVEEGDLSIDDAIALVEGVLIEFFATETCGGGCSLPDIDTPPFRLGVNGRFEMLDPETNEWGEPTGEYEIPPVPPREETTALERRCAAAANAASVMEQLYEAITDEIALGGDALQVAAAMVAALVTAVGGWIAAPVYAIVQLTIALFAGMIEILQALGADVWTEGFTAKLQCALYNCATDDGDVVTFELECIRANLYESPNVLDPSWFYELQLFAQVVFLMETITMDGLNAAGATTGVTTFNCDACDGWCYTFDFLASDEGFYPRPDFAYAEWISGEGWKSQYYSPSDGESLGFEKEFTVPTGQSVLITRMEIYQTYNAFSAGNKGMEIYRNGSYIIGANATNTSAATNFMIGTDLATEWNAGDVMKIRGYGSTCIGCGTSNEIWATKIVIYGSRYQLFGEDNCE